jgi:uncharacterized membrane protein
MLLAFVMRIFNIHNESLWRDEIDTIRFSFASITEMMGNLTRSGFNGPLYHLLMRGWLSAGGVNDFTLRYFSVCFGVLQVALVFVIARRWFGLHAGIVAAWFTILAPVLIWYSGEGKMYTLQPALLLLALYALGRVIDAPSRGRWNQWWLVFVVAVSLGYYMHLLTPLFLAVAAVFYVLWWPRSKEHWRGALIALALCTLPYVPMALWQAQTFLAGNATGHAFYSLDTMLFSLFYNWSVGLSDRFPPPFPATSAWVAMFAFVGVALVGVLRTVFASDQRRATMTPSVVSDLSLRSVMGVVAWLLLPATLVYLISTRTPVFEPRYVLWSAPALYILMGVGLGSLLRRYRLVAGVSIVLLSMMSLAGVMAQIQYPIRPDVRRAAQVVASRLQPNDVLVFQIPYTRYGLEYYLPQMMPTTPVDPIPVPDDGLRTLQGLRTRLVDAPFTNQGATPTDVNAAMQPLLARAQRVWLVEAETSLWDERQMARAWFDAHLMRLQRQDLRGISVSEYENPLKNRAFMPLILADPRAPNP